MYISPHQRSQLPLQLHPALPAQATTVETKRSPSSDVFPALENEGEKKHIKELLMTELEKWMDDNKLKQFEAARVLGVAPSRVSDAINKKTVKFTVDALIDLLSKVGKQVQIHVR